MRDAFVSRSTRETASQVWLRRSATRFLTVLDAKLPIGLLGVRWGIPLVGIHCLVVSCLVGNTLAFMPARLRAHHACFFS